MTDPYGTVAYDTYSPDGRMHKRTLGNGAVAYHEHDAAGSTVEVDNRKSDLTAICSSEYMGTAALDARGNRTTFSCDAAG